MKWTWCSHWSNYWSYKPSGLPLAQIKEIYIMAKLPDYRIGVLNKATDERASNLGAGWLNADGTISVVLNPYVVLPTGKQYVITLFPVESSRATPVPSTQSC